MDKKITIRNIKSSLPSYKKDIDRLDLWVYYFVRPLSYYFTWVFLKLKISPNFATIISAFIGFIGAIIMAVGTFKLQLTGAILINFWIIFDCVDGNIARFNEQTSKFGEFLDGISGYIFTSFLYTGIGLSVFLSGNKSIVLYNDWIYILLGCLTSLFTILPRLIEHKAQNLFTEYSSIATNKNNYNIFYKIGLNVAGMAGLSNPLLLIAVITKSLDLYLIFYFVVHLLIALYSIYKTLMAVPKN
ncbi:CDP-alcohol phosphatidyltransferase family protein [Caenibacillus caldisaponilyticus]|uniref:CDP-alcohol phosphatidyltransferase family protein n=1 Tax=Caenibacillus caldisaponilyticus TaxID=1674942 RepID=UPI001300E888|nr:CDP-alcohol phosphatidyltransferase family protein [Caenibacillus caldisaponilyticus]